MPISPGYMEAITAKLNTAREVTSKKMFGGAGMYCEGVFFGVMDNDATFFKHETARDWIMDGSQGGAQPYIQVPESVLNDPDELGKWIDAAVAYAVQKKASSKRRK